MLKKRSDGYVTIGTRVVNERNNLGVVSFSFKLRHEKDDTHFINRFKGIQSTNHEQFYTMKELEQRFLSKGYFFHKEHVSKITYRRRYNEHDIRLIKETPKAILSSYDLAFINDSVFITVTVIHIELKKIEERGINYEYTRIQEV